LDTKKDCHYFYGKSGYKKIDKNCDWLPARHGRISGTNRACGRVDNIDFAGCSESMSKPASVIYAPEHCGSRHAHDHFEVSAEPPANQLLAWRDRVGHVIDVLPTSHATTTHFNASIDRYKLGDRIFTDCSSDALLLDRSIPHFYR
jgi:hypothetical protein